MRKRRCAQSQLQNPSDEANLDIVRFLYTTKGPDAARQELNDRIKAGGDVFPYQMALVGPLLLSRQHRLMPRRCWRALSSRQAPESMPSRRRSSLPKCRSVKRTMTQRRRSSPIS